MHNNPATRSFNVMLKPTGAECNLACEYCYYLDKKDLYPGGSFAMSDSLLEAFTRQYIESQPGPDIQFAWQGGEPTLAGLDFYRRALALQEKYRKPGMRILNAIQTNGTRLDPHWCSLFKQHNFLVGISLDGPQEIHDQYRQDKAGKSSFTRVMRGLNLLKEHAVEFNILACISAANIEHPLETYRFLRDRVKAQYIQFIPILEYSSDGSIEPYAISAEQYGRFMISVFDEWVRRDVGTVFVQLFDTTLANQVGAPGGLCVFQKTCGLALILEHNGDLYSCDHYVDSAHLLGNILEIPLAQLVRSQRQTAFGQDKFDHLPPDCRECELLRYCWGGCPKHRTAFTQNGMPDLNHFCEGQKAFFKHVQEPMQTMASLLSRRLPPSRIMHR
jgi:uncharacterized protein